SGKRLSHLLRDPLARGMFRGIEMEESPPAVADDEEAVEYAECCRRHGEEIDGRDRLTMILKKGRPEPAGISSTAAHLAKVNATPCARKSLSLALIANPLYGHNLY